MKKIIHCLTVFLIVVAACSLVSGCAVTGRGEVSHGSGEPLQLYLFAARGFLGGSEYERYQYRDGTLWRECGEVDPKVRLNREAKKVEGDEVLPRDPSLMMRERRVDYLDDAEQQSLFTRAEAFFRDNSRSQRRPPLPGSVFSLAEPGMLELTVEIGGEKERLVTSVDAITEDELIGTTLGLSAAADLFANVRSYGPVICNAETFFGVGRK